MTMETSPFTFVEQIAYTRTVKNFGDRYTCMIMTVIFIARKYYCVKTHRNVLRRLSPKHLLNQLKHIEKLNVAIVNMSISISRDQDHIHHMEEGILERLSLMKGLVSQRGLQILIALILCESWFSKVIIPAKTRWAS